MGHVHDSLVSTKIISNVYMIYYMKVQLVSYDFGQKKLSVVFTWCILLTCWIIFHLKSMKMGNDVNNQMNKDLIAGRYMARWNWSTTILSQHEWSTWTTVINGHRVKAAKKKMFFWFSQLIVKTLAFTCSYSGNILQKIESWFLFFVPIVLESAMSSHSWCHNP